VKRARSYLLSLAGIILLGTVLLWAGTSGTRYWGCTRSLPGDHWLGVEVGGGLIVFGFWDLKRCPISEFLGEGFESNPVSAEDRNEGPHFHWETPAPGNVGNVEALCPVWFPGTLVGGLLLGWGLLCRRDAE